MAFEIIVQEQIGKLKAPTLASVDMVIGELTEIVRKCSEKVSISVPIMKIKCYLKSCIEYQYHPLSR